MKETSDASLSIVIPAYNEAENLPQLLNSLLPVCTKQNWRVIVVNDGSHDATPAILNKFASQYPILSAYSHKVQKGYGGALKTGIRATSTEYVLTFDADGQHQVADIMPILHFALAEDADMVVGKRPEKEQTDLIRKTGKWLIRHFANFLLPLPITDLNSGFKLYRTDIAKRYVRVCPDSMAFSDVITMVFVTKKHKVQEYPIHIKPRQGGTSTIGFHTAFETVLEILHLIMLFNPMRIFLPLALLFSAFGIAWAIPFLLLGRGLSSMAMLFILIGVLLFSNGLIANQISAMRLENLEDKP